MTRLALTGMKDAAVIHKGDRVIAATGRNRDVLRHGSVLNVHRRLDLIEITVDGGRVLVWPSEFVFREDGADTAKPDAMDQR